MRPLTFSFVLVVVALTAAYLPPLTEGVQQPLAPAEVRPQQAPEQALRGQLAEQADPAPVQAVGSQEPPVVPVAAFEYVVLSGMGGVGRVSDSWQEGT